MITGRTKRNRKYGITNMLQAFGFLHHRIPQYRAALWYDELQL